MPASTRAHKPLHRRYVPMALVFVGGVAGNGVRYAIEAAIPFRGTDWPWATFLINLTGAFILGALLEGLVLAGPDSGRRQQARLLVGTGFCGSYTTYSTFALETTLLAHRGATFTAFGYAAGSVVAGVVCVWLGFVAAGGVLRRRGEVS